jgi:hypothetical protein
VSLFITNMIATPGIHRNHNIWLVGWFLFGFLWSTPMVVAWSVVNLSIDTSVPIK